MVFHLPWRAAFLYHYLSPLLGVGGRGVSCLCFRAVASWPSVFVACTWGSSWWRRGGYLFSSQLSTPGKSLCLCLPFGQRLWNGMLQALANSPENAILYNLRFVLFCFYRDVISWDYFAQLSFTVGCFFLFLPSEWNSVLGAIWTPSLGLTLPHSVTASRT